MTAPPGPIHGTPLPANVAWRAVARCVGVSAVMLAQRQVHAPTTHVGLRLQFADGSRGRVYHETTVDGDSPAAPCVLMVKFRLRWVRGRGHDLFRTESVLNTPLFVGFPGFVSKLWVAHDTYSVYRGVYEWDGPEQATAYAGALWRVLALVSVRGSIDYQVLPRLRRDDLLAHPDPDQALPPWFRLVAAS
ncbi:MAG: hypothetical protein ACXVXC_04745 [Nocardioidaceae bacterium]